MRKRRRGAPVRYSARAYSGSKIVELAIGENLARVMGYARHHHSQSGQPSWVWRLKDGKTVFEIGAVSIYAASASARRDRPLSSLRAVLPAALPQRIPEIPAGAIRESPM